jgi:hypothetical protein
MGETFALPVGLNGGEWRPDGTIDLKTNSAPFKSRRIAQDDEPTLASGEMAMWNDTDGDDVFLVYNDPDDGQVKINLTSGGSDSLADLSDTTITNPQNNDVLKYIGGKWVNSTLLSLSSLALSGLLDQDIASAATSGDIIGFDSSIDATGTLADDIYEVGINISVTFSGTKGAYDATVLAAELYVEGAADVGSYGLIGARVIAHASATQSADVRGIDVSATKGVFGVDVDDAYGVYISTVQGSTTWALYNASGTNVYLGSEKTYIGSDTEITGEGDIVLRKNGVLAMIETTTPTADTNFGKIYTKSDNKLYFQDGAGSEHEVAFVP